MNKRYNTSNIEDISNKKIFFDANILIYLFWTTGTSWETSYAKMYSKLNTQNNTYAVDFIVISEFVNRAIRIEYEKYLKEFNLTKKDFNFKEYRDSKDGNEALEDIYEIVSAEILEKFEVVEKVYSKSTIYSLLSVDELDFSDKVIVQICSENNCILITNDKDFKNSNIPIISCNKNLF
ncbi:MAG: type II toxin-antitoxin system VapC family toxin [Arcobacteraceae bacterium]